jgi:hypothetical protein
MIGRILAIFVNQCGLRRSLSGNVSAP